MGSKSRLQLYDCKIVNMIISDPEFPAKLATFSNAPQSVKLEIDLSQPIYDPKITAHKITMDNIKSEFRSVIHKRLFQKKADIISLADPMFKELRTVMD